MTGQLEAGGARRFIHRWQSTGAKAPAPSEQPPIPWEFGSGKKIPWETLWAMLTTYTAKTCWVNGLSIGGEIFACPFDFGDPNAWADVPTSYALDSMTPLKTLVNGDGDEVGLLYKIAENVRAKTAWDYTIAAGDPAQLSVRTGVYNGKGFVEKTTYMQLSDGKADTHTRDIKIPIFLPVYDVYIVRNTTYKWHPLPAALWDSYIAPEIGDYATSVWVPNGITECAQGTRKGWDNSTKPMATMQPKHGTEYVYKTGSALWGDGTHVATPRTRTKQTMTPNSYTVSGYRTFTDNAVMSVRQTNFVDDGYRFIFPTYAGDNVKYSNDGSVTEKGYISIVYVVKQIWPTRKTPLCEV